MSTLLVWMVNVIMLGYACDKFFSKTHQRRGVFSSPYYPNVYRGEEVCKYMFNVASDHWVSLSFEVVNLHPVDKQGLCTEESIKIYFYNSEMKKTVSHHFCGQMIPEPFITSSTSVQVIYSKTRGMSYLGFFGTYEFINESVKIFPHSNQKCGESLVTGIGGVLQSPGWPDLYWTREHCAWIIKVKPNQQILLSLRDMNLPLGHCDIVHVSIYEGLADPDTAADIKFCGKLSSIPTERDYLTSKSRATIRFYSGDKNPGQSGGFKLSWTAVTLPSSAGACPGFYCEGGKVCLDVSGQLCRPLPRYCIDQSQACNGVPNCGAIDSSDEEGCDTGTLLIVLVSSATILLFFAVGVLVVLLCRWLGTRSQLPPSPTCIRNLSHSPTLGRRSSLPPKFTSFDSGFNFPDLKDDCPAASATFPRVVAKKILKKRMEGDVVIRNEFVSRSPDDLTLLSREHQKRPTTLPVVRFTDVSYKFDMRVHYKVDHKVEKVTKKLATDV